MILGFLFGDRSGKTLMAGIKIDVLENESLTLDGKVTRYPVEDGTEITDHIFVNSAKLDISGRISHIDGFSIGGSRVARLNEILDQFKLARDKRQTFEVLTGLRKYEEMAFESLKFERHNDQDGGNWLHISASMIEIRKVKLQTAEVPAGEAPTRNRTGRTATPSGRNTPSAQAAPSGTYGPQRGTTIGAGIEDRAGAAGGYGNYLRNLTGVR